MKATKDKAEKILAEWIDYDMNPEILGDLENLYDKGRVKAAIDFSEGCGNGDLYQMLQNWLKTLESSK